MTLKTLLYNIAEYAIGNKIINYSAAGPSLYGLNMETIKDYPVLFASPTGNHNITPNLTTYTITLYYIDRLTRGGDNDIDILSTSVEGLKSIINGIKYLPGVIEVYDDYNITNFADTQKMSDNVAGAYATITVRTANNSTCPDGIITDDSKNKAPVLYLIDGTKLGGSNFTKIPNSYKFSNITNMAGMFLNCSNLQTIPETFNTSNVTNMDSMFYSCSSLQTIPLIDTSNVTNMRSMFGFCSNLTSIPEINTSNVTDMGNMFRYCSNLTSIPKIDTSNVTDMNNMFDYCSSLQTIPEIDTSNVTNMRSMFGSCSNLQTIPKIDTSNVTDMREMFSDCSNLTTIPELDTSNVSNMGYMFNNCSNLTTIPALDCSSIGTGSNSTGWFGSSTLSDLTDIGGFINLKISSKNNYGLVKCPNLTYESCINVLNGLYDFTGNGETPDSSQGQLKVRPNFIDLVGDEISIAIEKGWFILQ